MKMTAITKETFLGVAWGLIPISYLVTESSTAALTLLIPIYVALIATRGKSRIPNDTLEVFALITALILQSLTVESNGNLAAFGYIRTITFLINILALLLLIKRENLGEFCTAFFKTTSAIAALHILLVLSGRTAENYGRYMFIGDSHPNLGGEIYAIAAFAGVLHLRKRPFLLLAAPLLISSYYLQSRTGSAILIMLILIKVFCENHNQKLNIKSLVIGGISMLILTLLALMVDELREFIVNGIFKADDKYRGLSTGMITGRDERWANALNIFYANPFFGNGINTFTGEEQVGAHSPILYALAMFGLSGIIFWAYFLKKYIKTLKQDIRPAIYILPVSLMIVINDRFLNSNPFPLFYYLFLIILARPVSTSYLRPSNR